MAIYLVCPACQAVLDRLSLKLTIQGRFCNDHFITKRLGPRRLSEARIIRGPSRDFSAGVLGFKAGVVPMYTFFSFTACVAASTKGSKEIAFLLEEFCPVL